MFYFGWERFELRADCRFNTHTKLHHLVIMNHSKVWEWQLVPGVIVSITCFACTTTDRMPTEKENKINRRKKLTRAWSIISRAGYRGIKHTNGRVRLSVCIFIINGMKTNRYDKFIHILTVHEYSVQCIHTV